MSKKYLIASGCSWTDADFQSDHHPEMICDWPKWPEILANKLDMKVINVGRMGSGNEGIYSRALDTIASLPPEKIGLVVIAWSQSQRRDFEYEFLDRPWTNEGVDSKGDLYYYVRRSLRYMYSLQQVCESLNIPYKQFQMINLFRHYLYQAQHSVINFDHTIAHFRKFIPTRMDAIGYMMESSYWDLIDEDNFIGWPIIDEMNGFNFSEKFISSSLFSSLKLEKTFIRERLGLIISEKDWHPNKYGHELLAEKIYEYL